MTLPLHASSHLHCTSLQAGKGSATLSMAYAAAEFADSCMRAMLDVEGIVECAYVQSSLTELPFFASPLRLGRNGIKVSCLQTGC